MAKEYNDNQSDLVLPDELLSSMAESLMTEATFYTVPVKEDAPPIQYGTHKPPTDLFYRKMPLKLMKPPMNVSQRRCSCMYLCTGAVAIIKCSSCAAMDVRGVGYFCQACFNARHPWYRVPHIFVNIEEDEASDFNRAHAAFKTSLKRCENEGKLMMATLQAQKDRLVTIGDDEQVDTGLRDVGRKVMSVETKLRELQRTLRKDIRQKDLAFCAENGVLGAKTPYKDPNAISSGGSNSAMGAGGNSLAGSRWGSRTTSQAGTAANSAAPSPRKAAAPISASQSQSRLQQTPANSRPGTGYQRRPNMPPPPPVVSLSTAKRKQQGSKLLTTEERLERDRLIRVALCTPTYIPLSQDEACVSIQRYWRRHRIQVLISYLYCNTIITKIFDDETGRFYYHNAKTDTSMWRLPMSLVLKRHVRYIKDYTYHHLEVEAAAKDRNYQQRDQLAAIECGGSSMNSSSSTLVVALSTSNSSTANSSAVGSAVGSRAASSRGGRLLLTDSGGDNISSNYIRLLDNGNNNNNTAVNASNNSANHVNMLKQALRLTNGVTAFGSGTLRTAGSSKINVLLNSTDATTNNGTETETEDSLSKYLFIPPNYWYCKMLRLRLGKKRHRRRTILGQKRACEVLQGFARCICARNRVLDQAYRIYTRVLDPASNEHYYYNVCTGVSSWTKPYAIFMKNTNPEPCVLDYQQVETATANGSISGGSLASARSKELADVATTAGSRRGSVDSSIGGNGSALNSARSRHPSDAPAVLNFSARSTPRISSRSNSLRASSLRDSISGSASATASVTDGAQATPTTSNKGTPSVSAAVSRSASAVFSRSGTGTGIGIVSNSTTVSRSNSRRQLSFGPNATVGGVVSEGTYSNADNNNNSLSGGSCNSSIVSAGDSVVVFS